MKTNTVWKSFIGEEKTLALSHRYKNDVYYHLIMTINDAILAEHIKDLCIEEIHPFLETLSNDHISYKSIEASAEDALQKVNHAFSLFAEQVDKNESIEINGALVVSYQGNILISLIGKSSLLITRQGKTIYHMTNSEDQKFGAISNFTDYISGTIHGGDTILILGFDYNLILHSDELNNIAQLIHANEPEMLTDLEDMMTSRTDESKLGFMSLVRNISQTIDFSNTKRVNRVMNYLPKKGLGKISYTTQTIWNKNSYTITIGILILIVLFSIYGIINGALNKDKNTPTLMTESGVEVVTIDEIKKEINTFQELDATAGDEKAKKYKEINDKLNFLKTQGKRLEDVDSLQKILQAKYYEGFNIMAIDSMGELGDEFSNAYSFSETESKTVGDPIYLSYDRGFYIGGSKGAIIKGINKDIKGTPVSYSLASTMKGCTIDLAKSGLYCFDDKNTIYHITAGLVTDVNIIGDAVSSTAIRDLGTFGKNNVYVMINPQSNGGVDLIRRYQIQAGNYNAFNTMLGYKYQTSGSGSNSAFEHMAIDGNFLSWSSDTKKLYEFQRDPNTNNLNSRIIPLQGGDNSFVTYSANVKVIASGSSRYVYLFDQDNNTFTVYLSDPLKTTQGNAMRYNLEYVMRYAFDKNLQVVDVAVPDSSGQPTLYILTANGIYEANLGAAIDLYKNK